MKQGRPGCAAFYSGGVRGLDPERERAVQCHLQIEHMAWGLPVCWALWTRQGTRGTESFARLQPISEGREGAINSYK